MMFGLDACVGQVRRQTQGKANPQLLETLLKDKLGS
jgi:Asp-tRNA(Asn)/Glu-tRNA(Gln) amidotransferase B subunit